MRRTVVVAGLLLRVGFVAGQHPAPVKPAVQTQAVDAQADAQMDVQMDAAQALIGRALILRGFYLTNDLAYDVSGRVQGAPKVADWTLAGMDVKKAERRGPKEIALEGVRVAIRYNPDNHQFERHPQAEEKLKVLVGDAGDGHGFGAALDAIFSQGIDPRLQRSVPPYWQHYFNPGLDWPPDALTGQQLYAANGLPNQAKDVAPPSLTHKVDLKMTPLAEKDKVRGTMQLRLVVDAEGLPRRIAVVRPLGYGLEERAVEAVSKWRFSPAMREGKPVAAGLVLNLDVEFVGVPR
jgi:TonB family protein